MLGVLGGLVCKGADSVSEDLFSAADAGFDDLVPILVVLLGVGVLFLGDGGAGKVMGVSGGLFDPVAVHDAFEAGAAEGVIEAGGAAVLDCTVSVQCAWVTHD